MNAQSASFHSWKFFRTGGLDQVALETGADLLALDQLDQKLWVALSCPVKGLELDEKTLTLIDADQDGRIGVPEVLAAVRWAAARLNEPGDLLRGAERLPLRALKADAPGGGALAAAAQQVLASTGRGDDDGISVAEAANTAAVLGARPLNGDGVIPPEATDDPALQALLRDIASCHGTAARRAGPAGVTADAIATFFNDAAAYLTWFDQGARPEVAVLGDATAAAFAALDAVRAKVDDFFARSQLAAFDARAVAALNRSEDEYLAFAAKDMKISAEELRGFPLARVEPSRPLPLHEGINPAWAASMAALRAQVVGPLVGAEKQDVTAAEWAAVNARLAPYEAWLGRKAGAAVEKLGAARLREVLAGNGRAGLAALVERDRALAPQYLALGDVERLVRYYRDLRTLLHNFVNFADFYSADREAVFQAGTLYLDSRATELCIRVDGPHALAAMSKAYIAYCACTRAGDKATMTIAACFTQGDSDYLFVGRNGVFYDRKGQLWYAVITSIVDSPISIRQAFWAPYKKLVRFIEEQVAKRAATAEAAANTRLTTAAEKAAYVDKAKAEPKKVDVGTVAAIGVAIAGATSALTLILGYVFQLAAWQYPLVLVGIVLVISTPSMVIAWLKLRQRTLGPILEANGWAVNGRVKINLPFGAALTQLATLPPGARRSLEDPYEDKEAARARRRGVALLVLLVLAGIAIAIRWDHNRRGHYFWQPAPPAAPAPAAPANPAAPAPAATPAATAAPKG